MVSRVLLRWDALAVGAALAMATAASLMAQNQGWHQVVTTNAPSSRYRAFLWHDPVGARMLMHAGQPGVWPGPPAYHDTWSFNGTTWTQLSPAHEPPWAAFAAAAYDSMRGRLVRFSGQHFTWIDETWEFDGVDWQQRFPAVSPSPRGGAAMAYDSQRSRCVLFGGFPGTPSGGGTPLTDTWEYDGTNWIQIPTTAAPTGGGSHRMVYDAARSRCVMWATFGSDPLNPINETWEWNGQQWTQANPPVAPSPRRDAALVYDPQRAKTLLFGGHFGTGSPYYYLDDTWEWDGANWVRWQTATAPSPRYGAAIAYDNLRGVVVLFSGYNGTAPTDTWEFQPRADFVTYGSGCPGSAGTPVLSANGQRPLLGQAFTLSLSNLPPDHSTLLSLGWSNSSWFGLALPLDLGSFGAPGCSVLASVDATYPVFNWGGFATWSLMIPNQANLLGLRLYSQAVSIEHVNALGLVFTNAGAAAIGDS